MAWGRGRGGRRGRGRGGRGGRGRSSGGRSGPRRTTSARSDRSDEEVPESQDFSPVSLRRGTSRRGSAGGSSSAVPGWNLFFPDEPCIPGFASEEYLELFKGFFSAKATMLAQRDMGPTLSVAVDFQKLLEAPEFADVQLAAEIRDSPATILRTMGLAIFQIIREVLTTALSQATASDAPGQTPQGEAAVPYVHVRLGNYEPMTPLKTLKANYIGKYISIKGTVVRVGNVKPLVTRMAFTCTRCKQAIVLSLPDGKYVAPTKCQNDECRSRTFMPDRTAEETKTVDFQTIRIQEIMEDESRESGRVPRTVECELTNDLVDCCVPGDIVVVNGEVKVVSTDDGPKGNKTKERAMFLLYLHANSITGPRTLKAAEEDAEGETNDMVEFSLKDLYAIQQIQEEEEVFKTLVNSLCPAIYGHEVVKAGLLLGLFGGRQKFANDVNRIPVRGDPHILVVGDPGLGKSQMLKAVIGVAPRGVYVCGNTTTTAGLTVALHKDGPGGDYALEAGALVLGDQGCCCIDEFDKMGTQHSALLEAMEQQCISIAKAGIVCSLPARTSIIAAANPVGGHYNKARTVSENLKMNGALLSRFDLVFILLDEADEKMDRLLSAHVMALHGTGGAAVAGRFRVVEGAGVGRDDDDMAAGAADPDQTLTERLVLSKTVNFDPIPAPILRKYVSYARKYVHPKLNPAAGKVLQQFYIDLRQNYRSPDSTPITTRQIESLVRLAEARARLELREEVTQQDAEDVVEMMKYSMMDTYSDGLGGLDFERSQHGSGMSKKAQAKKFISVLNRKAAESYRSIFSLAELRTTHQQLGLQTGNFMEFIDSLNNQGYLLKKGGRSYQLQTSDY